MAETSLAERKCVPCHGGMPPLPAEEIRRLHEQVPDWRVAGEHHLEKTFLFPDFRHALEFVNKVGELAEEEGHHPDLYLAWGQVKVQIWTHKVKGLTGNDFVLAAKIDRLPAAQKTAG